MTPKKEKELRDKIIAEAKSWIRTPYHHEAGVKGAGVDCGYFLIKVFSESGCMPDIKPAHYPKDFMCHRDNEWFVETILQFAKEITGYEQKDYKPADVVVFRQGRIFCHGSIILDWPMIIHSSATDKCVAYGDASLIPWCNKERRVFRYKEFK